MVGYLRIIGAKFQITIKIRSQQQFIKKKLSVIIIIEVVKIINESVN